MNNDRVGVPNFSGGRQRSVNGPFMQLGAAAGSIDVKSDKAPQSMSQPKPLDNRAAMVQKPAVAEPLEQSSLPANDEFILSVGDIRLKLLSLGISKSKDTIQRYCRDGALEWRKLGVFNRYFVTERSVNKLIEKLQYDAGADASIQLHASAIKENSDNLQAYEAAPSEIHTNDSGPHKAAPTNMQLHAGAGEKIETETPVHAAAHSLELEDEPLVKELRKTIERMEEGTQFLQDELRDRRQQTKALTTVIDAFKENAEASKIQALVEHARQEQHDGQSDYRAEVISKDTEADAMGENSQPGATDHGV